MDTASMDHHSSTQHHTKNVDGDLEDVMIL